MTEQQLSDIKLYCPYCGKVAETLEAHLKETKEAEK